MRLETLMSKARLARDAMGDVEQRDTDERARKDRASADDRWSTSPDPLIVQRFAAIAAKKASQQFALVRSKASAFRAKNLPVPVGKRQVGTRRSGGSIFSLSGWSHWWGGGEAA